MNKTKAGEEKTSEAASGAKAVELRSSKLEIKQIKIAE